MTLYHVCESWDGLDIEPLALRLGSENEAIDAFLARWPETDASFAAYHIQLVHLYATLAEAEAHAAAHGGQILAVDETGLEIKVDGLEFAHPTTAWPIPAAQVCPL